MAKQASQDLIATLSARFEAHPERHPDLDWAAIQSRLEASPDKLASLQRMEDSGGEPDVIAYYAESDRYIFCDCCAESPSGRRSLCFDEAALKARKKNKPAGSAMAAAEAMGVVLLNEADYRHLQTLGEFDLKTSSWIVTPDSVRQRGGALFGDRRYDQVFVYHNGAESYYAARGFRARLDL